MKAERLQSADAGEKATFSWGACLGVSWAFRVLRVLGVVLVLSPNSWAEQPVDSSTRAAARQLGYEGIQAYQAEKYAEAVDRLERAYKMLKAPSLALWSARALRKSGRLVEAAERYLEATRLAPEAGGNVEIQRQARESAAAERDELLPQVPQLLIEAKGATPEELTLTINGRRVSPAVIGNPRPTDPGEVVLEARRGKQVVTRQVVLVEAEKKSVVLVFGPAPKQNEPKPYEHGTAARDERSAPSWQKPTGIVLLGVGGAGLIFGSVTGVLALTSQIDECVDSVCPDTVPAGDLEHYNTMRTLSSVGLISGAVLAASGVTLILTAPKHEKSARLTPYVAGTTAGFAGRF